MTIDDTSLDDMWRSFVAVLSGQVEQDDQARAYLTAARMVASKFDVGLRLLVPMMDPQTTISYMGEGAGAGVITSLIDATEAENKSRTSAAKGLFDEVFAGQGEVQLTLPAGRDADLAARAARVADMLICQSPSCFPNDSVRRGVQENMIEAVLFESGHPALVMPDNAVASCDHPLIAWNDTAEVARAVSSAMPLLRKAGKVSLCHANDVDPAPVVAWLKSHSIAVEIAGTLMPENGVIEDRTGQAILDLSEKVSADVIVMGAFVHSRLRQLIIGGATRSVLKRAAVPVLLAH